MSCPFLTVARGQRVDPPPVWLMRQAGRYLPEYRAVRAEAGDFLSLVFDPPRAAEVTLQPVRRFALDAAILFSDILVIPRALGQPLAFREGEGPVLDALADGAAVAALKPEGVTEALAPVAETVERVRGAMPRDVALIGFAGAPWTVAAYMLEGGSPGEFLNAKRWLYAQPADLAALIALLETATIAYARQQLDAGADAFMLFDSWAGAVGDEGWDSLVMEPTRRIVDALRLSHPDRPLIGFPRGAGSRVVGYRAGTGMDVVALDQMQPLDWAPPALRSSGGAVQGNLDPMALCAGGEALRTAVRRTLDGFATLPHIFNLGHGVHKTTPPDHVAQLVTALRERNR